MENKKKSGLVTAGFVIGIIAIATCYIPIINNISIILGILAFIFGTIGLVKKYDTQGKAITGIVLGALSVIIALSLQFIWLDSLTKLGEDITDSIDEINSDQTSELLAHDVTVIIGDFEVIEDDYWDDTKLSVTVRNKSSEKTSFYISIEAVDEDGDRIDDDSIYADNLSAGQSQTFELFTYIDSAELEQYKTATFKILEIYEY